jgi:hypothetical protein
MVDAEDTSFVQDSPEKWFLDHEEGTVLNYLGRVTCDCKVMYSEQFMVTSFVLNSDTGLHRGVHGRDTDGTEYEHRTVVMSLHQKVAKHNLEMCQRWLSGRGLYANTPWKVLPFERNLECVARSKSCSRRFDAGPAWEHTTLVLGQTFSRAKV